MNKHFKILIVDDDPVGLLVSTSVLKNEYEIISAQSGVEAIGLVRKHNPDLILLDVMMREMSGYDVCLTLKSDVLFADIPIIFVTALDTTEGELRGLELGAIDYITKPINITLLQIRVKTQLKMKEQHDLIARQNEELFRHRDRLAEQIKEQTVELEQAIRSLREEITERKLVEKSLQESEEANHALLNASADQILLITTDGTLQSANNNFAWIYNQRPEEIIGQNIFNLLPAETARGLQAKLEKAIEVQQPLCYQDQSRGEWWDNCLFPINNQQGQTERIGVFARNITANKRHEEQLIAYQEQLRTLSSELSLTEARERRRIASDLHDNLGQNLALAKIKLEDLESRIPPSHDKNLLMGISDMLDESITYTRFLTSIVSPQALYTLPFTAAVEWLAERLLLNNGIQVKVVDDGLPKPLSEDSRILLFKTVRELLMNIVKHAEATNTIISLQREAEHILIKINDNGKGFDPRQTEDQTQSYSYGLFSIRERLTYLRGELAIISAPAQGTHIRITTPLQETRW